MNKKLTVNNCYQRITDDSIPSNMSVNLIEFHSHQIGASIMFPLSPRIDLGSILRRGAQERETQHIRRAIKQRKRDPERSEREQG